MHVVHATDTPSIHIKHATITYAFSQLKIIFPLPKQQQKQQEMMQSLQMAKLHQPISAALQQTSSNPVRYFHGEVLRIHCHV
mmetsp:Transcript_8491/g.17122  ORF Transcript_8491/g.17122 Transcript_8491/m.17122 type:complete len:82 (-) Transcript_8491:1089-1334(-)